jgi:hypothetical protein
MSQEMVDAEIVEHKFVGPDFLIIRLPDGTNCKLTANVTVSRIKDQKNPDGTPIFNISANITTSLKFATGRTIKVPKPQLPQQVKPPDQRINA